MKSKSNWLWVIAIITIGIIAISCDNNTNADACANGHDFPEWTAPTCEVAGNSERTCTRSGCNAADTRTTGFAALSHDWEYDQDAIAPTCTETGLGHRYCQRCDADEAGTTPYPALGHTFSWTMKTVADCITSEIEEGTCTVCGEEDTRYSPTNHALGHTLNAATKQTVSLGVFEDVCTRCDEIHAHEFTYEIGDTGPAGGIIFYVADGLDGRPDGITIQGYGSSGDNGYFAEYTAYYLEAAPANETSSRWQAASGNQSIEGVTTFTSVGQNNTLTIGVGRKDTQTIVNSTAFEALTDTAAQRSANKSLNGFTDWFLPSLGELNEMNKARVAGVTGIPTAGWFWSSSQRTDGEAWYQVLNMNNFQSSTNKSSLNDVRAIRAF